MNWKKFSEEKPPMGRIVLVYHNSVQFASFSRPSEKNPDKYAAEYYLMTTHPAFYYQRFYFLSSEKPEKVEQRGGYHDKDFPLADYSSNKSAHVGKEFKYDKVFWLDITLPETS